MSERDELLQFAKKLSEIKNDQSEYCWIIADGKCSNCGKEVLYNEIYPLDEKRDKSYQLSTKNCPVCQDWVRVHVLPTEHIGVCPKCDTYLDGMKNSHYVFLSAEHLECPACDRGGEIKLTDKKVCFLTHAEIVHLVEDILKDGPK